MANNKVRVYVKGASEYILERCSHLVDHQGNRIPIESKATKVPPSLLGAHETDFSADHREIFLRAMQQFAEQAHRTIMLAYKDYSMEDYESCKDDLEALETNLVALNIFGLSDPLRPAVPHTV